MVLEWLHRLEKYPTIKKFVEAKALRAALLIVAIILLFGVFQDINAVREALNVPPSSPKTPPAPIIVKEGARAGSILVPKPDTKPSVQVNNAPNGFAIGGGNVTNPTVNNFGPLPPKITWELAPDRPQPSGSLRPVVWAKTYLDSPFNNPAFEVFCDRPCIGTNMSGMGGVVQPFYINLTEDIVIFSTNPPNPLPGDRNYFWGVQSKDDSPVHIINVKTFLPPKN
jgi:hypothetical protein